MGGTYSLEDDGSGSSIDEDIGISSLELLIALVLLIMLELLIIAMLELDFGSSRYLLELEGSSLSPQKTSNKLSLPSLQPKTAIAKTAANKNTRILAI
jgi:hypothetical protein